MGKGLEARLAEIVGECERVVWKNAKQHEHESYKWNIHNGMNKI